MTVTHHPDETLLGSYAAGTLDQGRHIAVATHLAGCGACQRWVAAIETVGGDVLEALPPIPLRTNALDSVTARLGGAAAPAPAAAIPDRIDPGLPGLPPFVRRLAWGHWRLAAPGLRVRPLALAYAEETRVFLLKAARGTRLLEHSHTGVELTCVLSGSFRHDGGEYQPGDFDLGDGTVHHRITIGRETDCICLVAMQGDLRLAGIVGRLVQPFVRL